VGVHGSGRVHGGTSPADPGPARGAGPGRRCTGTRRCSKAAEPLVRASTQPAPPRVLRRRLARTAPTS
jgi:hypothetical protein